MRGKYTKKSSNIFLKIISLLVFLSLSFGAVYLGMAGGDFLHDLDMNIVQSVEVENFKAVLDNSWVLIDAVYNSGKANFSFTREIGNIVGHVFNFDLNKPITIFNGGSSTFASYYNKNYSKLAAQKDEKSGNTIDYSSYVEDNHKDNDGTASSVDNEYEIESKDIPNENVASSGKILVHNETKYKFNIEELLKEPLKLNFDKKGPKVLIYHTHTTESYIKNISELNKKDVSTWTEDPRYNVVRVGEELAQTMRKTYGIDVMHNGTIHDEPDYNSSYNKAFETVNNILKGNPSIRVVLDIHRDAGGDDKKLRAVTKVGDKYAAQVMFVVATGEIGLSHPNWKENLKMALKIQEKLNEICPGLAKPIYISKYRYNQHVSNGALIIEVGGDGNLLEESIESTKYLAKALNEVINKK